MRWWTRLRMAVVCWLMRGTPYADFNERLTRLEIWSLERGLTITAPLRGPKQFTHEDRQ